MKIMLGSVTLDVKGKLTPDEITDLRNRDISIWWNDTNCRHWCFDQQLCSGRWLENISIDNDLKHGTASVYSPDDINCSGGNHENTF